jgi:hypothetical protein
VTKVSLGDFAVEYAARNLTNVCDCAFEHAPLRRRSALAQGDLDYPARRHDDLKARIGAGGGLAVYIELALHRIDSLRHALRQREFERGLEAAAAGNLTGGFPRLACLRTVRTEEGDLLLDVRFRVSGAGYDFDVRGDVDRVAGLNLRGRRDLDVPLFLALYSSVTCCAVLVCFVA